MSETIGSSGITPPGHAGNRLAVFDVVRFAAAFAVVVYHLAFSGADQGRTTISSSLLMPACKYGYLGVDIFFVISGYFILLTAQGRDWRHFAAARFSRLYPALAACGVITFLVSIALPGWCWRPLHFTDLATHLSGLAFIPGLSGHFTFLDLVYWTLLIEIKYYLLVFFCLVLRVQFPAFLALMLVSFAVGRLMGDLPGARILTLYGYGGHFVAGGTLYLLGTLGSRWDRWAIFTGAVIAALSQIRITAGPASPYDPVVSIGVFLAGLALLVPAGMGSWNPNWRFAAFLGGLTYPLYLIHHQAGCVIARWLGIGDSLLGVVGVTLASTATAAAVYLLIEKPLMPRIRKSVFSAIGGQEKAK